MRLRLYFNVDVFVNGKNHKIVNPANASWERILPPLARGCLLFLMFSSGHSESHMQMFCPQVLPITVISTATDEEPGAGVQMKCPAPPHTSFYLCVFNLARFSWSCRILPLAHWCETLPSSVLSFFLRSPPVINASLHRNVLSWVVWQGQRQKGNLYLGPITHSIYCWDADRGRT